MSEDGVEFDEEEVARRAVAALRAEAEASGAAAEGFQPPVMTEEAEAPKEERRKVRPNNTVVFQNASYGPLPEDLAGESVRIRVNGSELQVRTESGRVLGNYPLQEAGGEGEDEE
jgi:N utilization substance protein A